MGGRQWFVLYVLVCLEVGFFLMLVPWSAIWERNYFLEAFPDLRPVLLSLTLRGAVCGLGLANLYLGVTEILNRLRGVNDERAAYHSASEHEHVGRNRDAATSEHDATAKALAAPEER